MSTEAYKVPPGKPVQIGLIDSVRVADDRIIEHWNAVDSLGLLQHVGVLPQSGQATGKL